MYRVRAMKTGHVTTMAPAERRTLAWAINLCRQIIMDPVDLKASWIIEHETDDGPIPLAHADAATGRIMVLAESTRPFYRVGGLLDQSDEHRAESPNCSVCAFQNTRQMAAQTV